MRRKESCSAIKIMKKDDENNYRKSMQQQQQQQQQQEASDAATTIQAVYRGYRARSKYHEIRKSCSEERQKTRRIAELLAATSPNPDNYEKPLRLSVSLRGNKNEQSSKIPRRSPSPRKNKRINFSSHEHSTINDLKLDIAGSVPDENHTGDDSIRTIHRPIFHNFDDEKTSSVSDDTEMTDSFNFTSNDNPEMSTNGVRGSLFFPNCESIVVFGGIDPHEEYGNGGNTGKDIYRFGSSENEWEYVGEMPEPRHCHSTVYLGGRVYLVGGADPRNDDDDENDDDDDNIGRKELAVGSVWSYDPMTRVWFMEAELSTPRKDFGLVVSEGKMYAIGGRDNNGLALRSVEAFDPLEGKWREMRPMNVARIGPAAAKYRELIWVGGGMTTTRSKKQEPLTREVECYDPLNDRWLRAEPLRSPRCFASMHAIGDRLYVIGGATGKTTTAMSIEAGGITESIECVDVWDRESLVWRKHGEIGIARHGQAIGSMGERLLVIGGSTTVYMRSLRSVECYCCQSGKVIKGVSSLPHPLSGHGSVSLPPANYLTTI